MTCRFGVKWCVEDHTGRFDDIEFTLPPVDPDDNHWVREPLGAYLCRYDAAGAERPGDQHLIIGDGVSGTAYTEANLRLLIDWLTAKADEIAATNRAAATPAVSS
jgi:hypothetical protein